MFRSLSNKSLVCFISRMSTNKKPRKRVQIGYENDQKPASEVAAKKTKTFEPENWQQVLENIRKMRKDRDAPVDSMGCEKCFEDAADEKTKRFQILISLMLSAMTKDEVTFAACHRLKTVGFNPKSISEAEVSTLEDLLKPVGFYKTKAKNIKNTSLILLKDYNCDIPNSLEDLQKLPGVGPKMAHIAMKSAWGQVTGIGVDVHVHRISNRLNWVSKPTADPEKTRLELESWLPFELWSEVNLLLVGFGQMICSAKSPKCSECLNKEICPSAFKNTSPKKKAKE